MKVKKMAILQTAFLGDAILVSPMLETLHNEYGSNIDITLILKKGLEDIFKSNPYVSSIITFDKRGRGRNFTGLVKFISQIRKQKFDTFINVHRSWRSGLVTIFSGAKLKIGFKEAGFSFLFDKTVKRQGLHEVLKNHKLLELLDDEFKNCKPDIKNTYKLHVDCNSQKDGKTIIIAPGSRWLTKRWTLQGYADLSNMIISQTDFNIVYTGDNNDTDFVEKIISEVTNKSRLKNTCGKLSIKELLCLIKKSSLVITNDSAPQHIAVGFNIPVVSIFGPTTKDLGYYPYSDKAVVIENPNIKCRPCGKHGHMKCPRGGHECMNSISADMVYKTVSAIIKNT
ncbi:MAG: glycosyltransferase family 9 protein [Oligoflexia bacterium]|nr:glycosyltransferase family 9 protein [Oligoflexia bacterium]